MLFDLTGSAEDVEVVDDVQVPSGVIGYQVFERYRVAALPNRRIFACSLRLPFFIYFGCAEYARHKVICRKRFAAKKYRKNTPSFPSRHGIYKTLFHKIC